MNEQSDQRLKAKPGKPLRRPLRSASLHPGVARTVECVEGALPYFTQTPVVSTGDWTKPGRHLALPKFVYGQSHRRSRRRNHRQGTFWFSHFPGRFRFGGARRRFCVRGVRKVEIPAAVLAKLNVRVVHQCGDNADGHAHVTAGADLVADGGDAFLSFGGEAVVVAEDLLGNFAAQVRDGCPGVFFFGFSKFERLKPDEILQ